MKQISKLAIVNIIINTFLAAIKLTIGLMFSSASILSDAFNSLGDIFTAVIIYVTIKINNTDADANHQFGHSRAESIAGYTIGILMVLLGVTLIRFCIEKIITKEYGTYSVIMLSMIGISITLKLILYFWTVHVLKTNNSPAMSAIAKDHLSDILVLCGVLIGVIGMYLGISILDPIIGLVIAGIVFYNGIRICLTNISELMGTNAPEELILNITKHLEKNPAIVCIEKIKSQHLGNKYQVEIHMFTKKDLSITNTTALARKMHSDLLETFPSIINATFIYHYKK